MRGPILVMASCLIGALFLAGQAEGQPSAILPALSDSQTTTADSASLAMPAPSLWDLLGNPSVEEDLELVDDQLKQIHHLRQQMARESRQLYTDFQGTQNYQQFAEQIGDLKRKYIDRLEDVLLPLQIERMQQIALQMHLKNSGTANAIISPMVAEALGLSDRQVAKLQEKSRLLERQLAADIQKLKEERDETLLNVLTPQQRAKLSELQGDNWAPKPEDWSKRLEQIRRQQEVGNDD